MRLNANLVSIPLFQLAFTQQRQVGLSRIDPLEEVAEVEPVDESFICDLGISLRIPGFISAKSCSSREVISPVAIPRVVAEDHSLSIAVSAVLPHPHQCWHLAGDVAVPKTPSERPVY